MDTLSIFIIYHYNHGWTKISIQKILWFRLLHLTTNHQSVNDDLNYLMSSYCNNYANSMRAIPRRILSIHPLTYRSSYLWRNIYAYVQNYRKHSKNGWEKIILNYHFFKVLLFNWVGLFHYFSSGSSCSHRNNKWYRHRNWNFSFNKISRIHQNQINFMQ